MRILDLGCGGRKYAGGAGDTVIGLDLYRFSGVDVIHDLNGRKQLPFKDGEFDMVCCSHTLEHLADVGFIINEVWRVLKPGGLFKVAVPHFSWSAAYTDLTHAHYFGAFSFDPWLAKPEFTDAGHHVRQSMQSSRKFELARRRFDCSRYWFWMAPIASRFPKLYEGSFLRSLFPMASLYFELKAVK